MIGRVEGKAQKSRRSQNTSKVTEPVPALLALCKFLSLLGS